MEAVGTEFPITVGGPISAWPMSASTTRRFNPRPNKLLARYVQSVLLPTSVAPITITFPCSILVRASTAIFHEVGIALPLISKISPDLPRRTSKSTSDLASTGSCFSCLTTNLRSRSTGAPKTDASPPRRRTEAGPRTISVLFGPSMYRINENHHGKIDSLN